MKTNSTSINLQHQVENEKTRGICLNFVVAIIQYAPNSTLHKKQKVELRSLFGINDEVNLAHARSNRKVYKIVCYILWRFLGEIRKPRNPSIALLQTLLVPYTVCYLALSFLGFEQPAYLYVNGLEDFRSTVLICLLCGAGLMVCGAYRSWQELMKKSKNDAVGMCAFRARSNSFERIAADVESMPNQNSFPIPE